MAKIPVLLVSFAFGGLHAAAESVEATSESVTVQKTAGQSSNEESKSGVITPESAVLPANVARFRGVYVNAEGESGFDASGKKTDSGIEIKAVAGAAIFEYGLNEKISLQFLAPLRKSTSLSVADKSKFLSNYQIQSKVEQVIDGQFAAILQNATIAALYNSNTPAPQNIPITGTSITIPSGTPVKTYLDTVKQTLVSSTVASEYEKAKSSAEATKFDKGLGDIELGAKYNFSSQAEPRFSGLPLYFSVGLGVRLNSSGYAEAVENGITPFGRGTTDLGLRLNADMDIVSGLQLHLENQTEMMLAKGKTFSGGKEVDYERVGSRQIGYAKFVLAPGAWASAVDMIRFSAKYNYDNDAKTKTNGVNQTDSAATKRSATYGISYNGFVQNIPVQVDFDLENPISGKNQVFVTENKVLTLKLYNRF